MKVLATSLSQSEHLLPSTLPRFYLAGSTMALMISVMSLMLSLERMTSTWSMRLFSRRIKARREVRSQILVLSSWFWKIYSDNTYLRQFFCSKVPCNAHNQIFHHEGEDEAL